ncbi:MAG: hypothetical protein EOO06_16030 [Chitinophagaceae bacterium]|nr:MAG: hypothetical protein EOO06_16030 [Chitinophagaceae bacterium]
MKVVYFLGAGASKNFRLLVNRSIGELLLKYEMIPYTSDEKLLLDRFIQPIKNQKLVDDVTFITTNYDLVIDHEFMNETLQNRVDYGISYRNISNSRLMAAPDNAILKYYKLHGSLNWLRCSLCGHYYINPFGSIVHQAFKEHTDDDNTCICSKQLRLKTVLVSPSLVRDIRDSNLLQIWKAALEAIRTADKLVFIGYSLPAEDLAIKSIIMRGLNGRDKNQDLEIGVVQYGNAARNNYLNLFETNITYYENGLEEYLQTNSTI